MSSLIFFECRECPGRTCRKQIETEGEEVIVEDSTCTIGYPPHGARPATETRQQRWEQVETREVSDDVE